MKRLQPEQGGGSLVDSRCDRCKHWAHLQPHEDGPMDFHLDVEREDLDSPAPTAPHRPCGKLVHLFKEGHSRTDVTRPAYLMDASGYVARLWTRPDFGCSAFETLR